MRSFVVFIAAVALVTALYYLNLYDIHSVSRPRIFSKPEDLPHNALILVPGSGRNYPGRINYLFTGRVEAAASLYKTGRYDTVVVSGLSDGEEYDEANDLKNALVEKGIPSGRFILDHDSKDTFASLLWFRKHFPDRKVIFVSQRLHLERMIWMGRQLDIDCTGLESAAWPGGIHKWFYVRERGARIKARYEMLLYKIFGYRLSKYYEAYN